MRRSRHIAENVEPTLLATIARRVGERLKTVEQEGGPPVTRELIKQIEEQELRRALGEKPA